MFGDGAHDGRYGRFLEGVRADGRSWHLAADDHHRHRVGHGIAHRRDRVGRARAGGHHDDADLAARAGIAGCHEPCTLFVGRDYELHRRFLVGLDVVIVVAEYRVIDRQDCAARIAEDRIHAFVGQDLHHGVRA